VKPENKFRDIIVTSWSDNPQERPSFNQIYTQLENSKRKSAFLPTNSLHLQNELESSQPWLAGSFRNARPQSPKQKRFGSFIMTSRIPDQNSNGQNGDYNLIVQNSFPSNSNIVSIIFGHSIFLSWSDFSKKISWHTNNTKAAEKMRYVLDPTFSGRVDREIFYKLTSWFDPFNMENMLEILDNDWFHGFLDIKDAKSLLSEIGKPGTFLVRFSSQIGAFALSVFENNMVCHCRIDTPISLKRENSTITNESPPFSILTNEYKSLNEVVERHQFEPLGIKDAEGIISKTVLLKEPLPRISTFYEI